MGSPVSSIIANIYMEYFEEKVLRTAENLPRSWKRYMDNPFIVQETEHKDNILRHINSLDQSIKLTVEDTQTDGSMLFFDTLVTLEPDRTLYIRVNRNPVHTDQYLHWDSHHHRGPKYSVINTLHHRARTVFSPPNYVELKKNT